MIFLSAAFLILSFYFAKEYFSKKMFFEMSFFAAGFYFLYIPFLYILVFDYLPIPMEFSGTWIPDVFIDKYDTEILSVSAFWFLMNFFIYSINYLVPIKKNNTVRDISDKSVFFVFCVYELFAIALFVASGLHEGEAHWARSKEEFMQEQGTLALLLVFSTAGLRLLAVAILVERIFSSMNKNKFSICLAILAATDLYTTGNRITLLVILFVVVFNLFFFKRYKFILIALLISIPFGFFMTMYRILRSQLHSEDSVWEGFQKGWYLAIDNMHFDSKIVLEFVSGVTESININVLLGIFRDFGNVAEYVYGASYFKSVVWWIPRSIYEDKPETITVIAAKHFSPYSDGSLVTTVIGESFINFSYLGVILTPFLIYSFKAAIVKFFGNYRFFNVLCMIYGFVIFRMAFSDLFIYLCFSFIFYFAFDSLSRRRLVF